MLMCIDETCTLIFLTGKFEVESLVAIGMEIHSFENAEHTIGFIRSRVTRIFYTFLLLFHVILVGI